MSHTGHTPRSAAVLLSDALSRLDTVEPSEAREPVRQMFRATIELCAVSNSLAGKPVTHVLQLAQALVDSQGRR